MHTPVPFGWMTQLMPGGHAVLSKLPSLLQIAACLVSGYRLAQLVTTTEPCVPQVSGHLKKLFEQFGSPLFVKRDSGGNLNHGSVNTLISRSHVLPLNIPCYYALYNGMIERG